MAGEKNANELLDGILGNANPGNSGEDDGGDNDALFNQEHEEPENDGEEPDTGPVTEDDGDGEEQDNGDAGDADDPNEDLLAKRAREARKGQQPAPKQGKQQPKDKKDTFNPRSAITTDKAGNVYSDGELVARSGREARNFMEWRKAALSDRSAAMNAHKRLNQVALGAQELVARYDELKKSKTALDGLSLSPQEQSQLIQVAAAFKRNPVDGIKLLLTQAHLAGVDIKSIVGNSNPLDMKALTDQFKGEIQAMLKPVIDQTSAREKQASIRAEAQGFFDRNPRAEIVSELVGGTRQLGKLLNEAKRRAPDVPLDELFQRLDYALMVRGVTAPVTRRPPNPQQRKKMNKTFSRNVTLNDSSSVDDIGRSVLADIQAAENRGF